MEDSRQSGDVVALGKILASELGAEQSTNTLGHWLAHHIAELLIKADQAEGKEKSAIEDRCRTAILDLWRQIEIFPRGIRPLENLDPILATIRALDPDNLALFYQSQAHEAANESRLSAEAQEWLTLARGLDYSARLLIDMCLKNAANSVSSGNRKWYELAKDVSVVEPLAVAVGRMLSDSEVNESDIDAKKARIELLRNRNDRLQGMVQMAKLLASEIEKEIADLKS